MTVMKIEIVPDPAVPTGGHAIIRLKGIALLPPGATYRIDPIDDALNEPSVSGWPHGDLRPLETRQTPDGVEMRIGPEVVDAPLLEPGTPVTLSVAGGDVSADIVWPDLPVSPTGAAGAVVMTPSQMAAEISASEREKAAAATAAAIAAALAEDERQAHLRAEAEQAAAIAALAASTDQQRMAEAARKLEAALALEPDKTGAPRPLNGVDWTVAPAAKTGAAAPQQGERARTPDTSLSSLTNRLPERLDAGADADRDQSLPAIVLKRGPQAAMPAQPNPGPEPTRLRREPIEGSLSQPPNRLLPFLAGAGAASLVAALICALLLMRPGLIGAPPTAQIAATTAGKPVLADAFTAGLQSPRGEIATDIDLPTALRLADYNLHGVDRPIDRAEAEFWLKKAMSLTASHSQIRWAMTQLGTLSAEPVTGVPDYEKARLLWEIAAANGDPMAMCFLGTLLEYGLGAAADKAKALEYFKRAKTAGGCPNSDEAIARLSK